MAEFRSKPDIRYGEFTDAWEQRNIEDCFTERNERSGIGDLISVTMNSGVMRADDLGRHDTSSDDKSNYKKVEVGDIAYNSMRMWQGASGYSPYSGILSPAYTVITPQAGIHSPFFAYLFKRPNMIHAFKINSQGLTSDTWNLKWPSLRSIGVSVPSLEEQQRISAFFAVTDNLITLHQREYEKTVNIKKAMLEKMFPKDGEDRPEIRFAGFTDAWEQRKLNSMVQDSYTGVSVNSEDVPASKNEIGVLKTSSIHNSIFIPEENKAVIASEVQRVKSPIVENSIVVSRMNTPALVGELAYIDKSYSNLYLPDRLWMFTFNLSVNTLFVNYSLNTSKNHVKITDLASGTSGSMKNISKTDFLNISIHVPDYYEQLKIGDFFLRLDNLITLHQRELEKLQNMKKALLEKMFI